MIEFAQILGETEGNRTRIMFRTGETLFVPITIMGSSVSIPSAKWIKQHKKEFLALVSFEKDIWSSPMIVGFYPVKGASSKEYNTHERLIGVVEKLIEQLSKARVNTQIGPQKFMPDTLMTLDELKNTVKLIKEDIGEVKL